MRDHVIKEEDSAPWDDNRLSLGLHTCLSMYVHMYLNTCEHIDTYKNSIHSEKKNDWGTTCPFGSWMFFPRSDATIWSPEIPPLDHWLYAHSASQQLQDFKTFWKPEGHVGFPHAWLQRLLEDNTFFFLLTKHKNDMVLLLQAQNVFGVNPEGFYWKVSFTLGGRRVSAEKEVDWNPYTDSYLKWHWGWDQWVAGCGRIRRLPFVCTLKPVT